MVFRRGLRVEVLDFVGDWEFGNLVLMGILKLNSAGDMYFEALALLRISPGMA